MRVLVLGAGGFGRECLDVLEAIQRTRGQGDRPEFVGFIDPDPILERLRSRDAPWLGDDSVLEDHTGSAFVVGVGAPTLRQVLAMKAQDAGLSPVTLVHPSSSIGSMVEIGAGTVICSQASVTTNVRIGDHVNLNPNASVGHDCEVGDFVTITPGASISGGVVLEPGVWVGTNAAVLQGVRVGRGTVIGAGAVVTEDLPPGVVAVGIPARVRK